MILEIEMSRAEYIFAAIIFGLVARLDAAVALRIKHSGIATVLLGLLH